MPLLLLVDDDDGVTTSLGGFLQRSGFEVVATADGHAGLAAFAARRPDVVVLDVNMPGLDGRAVLRRLRRLRGEDTWVPVVMLTQVGESGERAMALDEGADDYLNKPFDPEVPTAPWPLPTVRADADLLLVAVHNVGANALK